MKLNFATRYRSINAFPEIDLPDFTVLTGLNGSGKTHVLQAIANKNIEVSEVRPRHSNLIIKYLSGTDIGPPQNLQASSSLTNYSREDLVRSVETARAAMALGDFKRNLDRLSINSSNPREIASYSDREMAEGLVLPENDPKIIQFSQAVRNLEGDFLTRMNQTHRDEIVRLARALQKRVFDLDVNDFEENYIPNWGAGDIFQQSIAHLFVTYRDLRMENNLKRIMNDEDGGNRHVFSHEEFVSKFGRPPWETLNLAFQAADLDFEITAPAEASTAPFKPELVKRGTDLIVPFTELSSGEKIIMSFTLLAFQSSDRRQTPSLPDILLLDEPDAHLHPSMSKALLDVIQEVLVDEFKIKVIATTHSPSTVALANEGKVFSITRGVPGLAPCSKAQALNLLTAGVPTLAVDFSGRRQVFVEDESDAIVLAKLFLTLQSDLPAGRSLEFIPTGLRSNAGETVHSGSSVVRHLVTTLEESGNKSVFGLLDWDGKSKRDGRIFILAEGRRDALENILLDPLLLASLICRQYPKWRVTFGIAHLNWDTFRKSTPPQLQTTVDAVGTAIFDTPCGSKVSSQYSGGLTLDIDARWFTMDDHTLTDLILDKLQFLNSIAKKGSGKGAENLMLSVVDFVIGEHRAFTPIELCEIFTDLLTFDAH